MVSDLVRLISIVKGACLIEGHEAVGGVETPPDEGVRQNKIEEERVLSSTKMKGLFGFSKISRKVLEDGCIEGFFGRSSPQ